jgi:nucleotide-binding universal stress UspA family protein
MLVRLEHALNCPDLAKQMMLVPKASALPCSRETNLVVGYNGSTRSQTALDLTLWIAHQTRLVSRRSVTVHVVYVVDEQDASRFEPDQVADLHLTPIEVHPHLPGMALVDACDRWDAWGTAFCNQLMTHPVGTVTSDWSDLIPPVSPSTNQQVHQFEKADRILWQARHLAEEWRGSLETHLRFGRLAEELRTVASQVSTTALILGCSNASDSLIQALGQDLPFPILGIPANI